MCGFPLTQWGGGAPPQPQEAPRQAPALSVLQALKVGRPAKWQFWVGISLLLVVLACCPCSLGLLVLSNEGAVTPLFGVLACLFTAILVLGILLMFLGRPRRLQ